MLKEVGGNRDELNCFSILLKYYIPISTSTEVEKARQVKNLLIVLFVIGKHQSRQETSLGWIILPVA